MTDLLYRLGRSCARHPWRTVLAWLLVVAAATALSTFAGGVLRDDMTAPGTATDRAQQQLLRGFPDQVGAEAHVVATWPQRIDTSAVEKVRTRIGALPGVRTVSTRTQGRTAMLVVRYRTALADLDARQVTARLTATAEPLGAAGAQVGVGGEVPESVQGPNGVAEAIGVVVALAVLLFAFGSVLAAGLPLLVAAFGLGLGLASISLLALFLDVNTVSPTLGSMIGLGLGIDYALFIVARHRAGLLAGLEPVEAAAQADAEAGRSVVFAGGTVLIALCGLAFSGVPSFASMGYAAGLVVAATVAVAVTLLPALLAAGGTRLLGRRAGTDMRSLRAERLARTVARRPLPWLILAAVVLLALAAPALGMRLGQNDAGSERAASPTRQAYDLVAAAFGPGANGPLTIVADHRREPDLRWLSTDPAVADVSPAVVSPDGRTAVISVTPSSAPQSAQTQDLVRRVRDRLPAGAGITGPTAAVVDLTDVLADHLWRVITAVLLASLVLLAVVFRSIVLPIKAVLTNLLSVGAAYGVMTLGFQTRPGAWLLGLDGPVPIPAWAPMVLFAILFGLSMDYEVFTLSRVRQRRLQTGDTVEAVALGLGDTARIITSAGAIMIAVAAGFALDPGVMVKIIGVGLAAAILVDVTIARLVLVPAVMVLLGERNWSWWPLNLSPRAALGSERVAPETDGQPGAGALTPLPYRGE
ncbi:MMPL family transporter [Micromonosporaceae bacterium Da 78-11]